ncbi:MAG: Smr/MutS family protein, partial [Flavobacteriales bacterium]
DDDGFKRPYLKSQLVIVQDDSYSIDDEVVASITMQDSGINQETSNNSIRNRSNLPEINLHIEELTDSHTHLSNFEILSQQMIVFRQFFQMAKHKRKAKIVVIHGVGEGVLRYEVRSFLNKENGIEYYDGDYFEYGQGATIIEISYKS